MKKDDLKILSAIETGEDQQVLNLLYKKIYPKIRNYIIKNSGSNDAAMDIFQEAVIIFYQQVKLKKFDSVHSIDGFIYTISKNLWINAVRKNNRQTGLTAEEENRPSENEDLYEKSNMEKELAKEIFDQLGGQCRELLELVIFRNYNMNEVADMMGFSSRHSAKTQHYKCKKKLISFVEKNPMLLNKIISDQSV